MKESTTRPPPQSILCTTPKRVNSTNSSSTAQSSGRTIQTSYQTQVYNFTPQNIGSIEKITLKNKLFIKSLKLKLILLIHYFFIILKLILSTKTVWHNTIKWSGLTREVWLVGCLVGRSIFIL